MDVIRRQISLVKIGDKCGVIIDPDVMKRMRITPETPLEVEVVDGAIVATPLPPLSPPVQTRAPQQD